MSATKFVKDLVIFLTAIAGGAAFTQLAPEYGSALLTRAWMLGLVAVAWAVARLLAWSMRDWRHSRTQFIATVLVVIAASLPFCVLLVMYIEPWAKWTAPCYEERHVIGVQFTAAAETYVSSTGVSDPEHLLKAVSCQPELVWQQPGIIANRQMLWREFIPLLLLITFLLTWPPAVFIRVGAGGQAGHADAAGA